MIKKVLIAEDHKIVNLSIKNTMEDLGIAQTDYVYYCDDALEKIRVEYQRRQSYDLLITDLYFEKDSRAQKISGGESLVREARKIQPDVKILVFSAENKDAVIQKIYNEQKIDGYVCKGRNDAEELKLAIETIANNQCYRPRHLMQMSRQMNAYEFTQCDITILELLAAGVLQKNMPVRLQEKGISPCSLSSIEKRLNIMKEALDCSKNEQLVILCKEKGII